MLEMLGGRDHRDGRNLPAGEQLGCDGQGVGGLPGAGRSVEQEIAPWDAEVLRERFPLPGPQRTQQILPEEGVVSPATRRQRTFVVTHRV